VLGHVHWLGEHVSQHVRSGCVAESYLVPLHPLPREVVHHIYGLGAHRRDGVAQQLDGALVVSHDVDRADVEVQVSQQLVDPQPSLTAAAAMYSAFVVYAASCSTSSLRLR